MAIVVLSGGVDRMFSLMEIYRRFVGDFSEIIPIFPCFTLQRVDDNLCWVAQFSKCHVMWTTYVGLCKFSNAVSRVVWTTSI